jgi:regulator of sigma E protease
MAIMATLSMVGVLLLAIGLMIWLHELGHFLAATAFGVRVDVFSLGFGTRLAEWRWGDTYWRISLIALGGFTKLAGEHSHEAVGDPQEYLSKPRWVRLIIACAGAGMNMILAILLSTVVFYSGYQRPAYLDSPAEIGWVDGGSPAAAADIQAGDRIVRVAALKNPDWADVQRIVAASGDLPLEVSILRDGMELSRTVSQRRAGWGQTPKAGWHPVMPAKIANVVHGFPAERAGLRPGDKILSIDGESIRYWPRLNAILGDQPFEMVFLRSAAEERRRLQPIRATGSLLSKPEWSIGVTFDREVLSTRNSLSGALAESMATQWNTCRLFIDILRNAVLRRLSVVPLPVSQMPLSSDEPGGESVSAVVLLFSMVSLCLAICNLLPIPLLDGGVILSLIVEMLLGRDLSPDVKERLFKAGFVFLLLIVVSVIYLDVSRMAASH